MPPNLPIGPYRGVEPIEASGTGLPKRRGPQGQDNRGDAGYGPKLPNLKLPTLPALRLPGGPQRQPIDLAPEVDDSAPNAGLPFPARPSVEHTKTVSGWFKNFYKDVEDFFLAIPASVKVAWQAGSEIVRNYDWLDDLVKNPDLLTKELDNTTRVVIKSLTDEVLKYRHGTGEALYKHPFSVMLDLLTVVDLAGGALKASAKVGMKLGSREAASLARLGQSIQSYPGRMLSKPFELTARALEKTPFIGDLMRAKALTPLGKEVNNLFSSTRLQKRAEAEPIARELFRRKIPKKLRQEYEDFLDGLKPREAITDPRILERYDEWNKKIISDERDLTDLGIFTHDELTQAKLKQVAIKLKERGYYPGELHKLVDGRPVVTEEAIKFAEDWIAGNNPFRLPTKPVYRPFTHERGLHLEDILEALKGGEGSEAYRKWSRLQERTGLGTYVKDPDIWQAKSILQKAELDAVISSWNESVRRYGKPLTGPKADPGYRIMPPLLAKYVTNDIVNAQTLLLQNMREAQALARSLGTDSAQAMYRGVLKTRQQLMDDAARMQDELAEAMKNPKEWAVQVPEEVAYIMDKNLHGPRGFWRWYDNALDTWRDMLLTFMPRYYVNNLLGNAVVLFFGGHNPVGARAALGKDIPGEAMNSMLATEAGSNSSWLGLIWPEGQKGFRRASAQLADITDNRPRQVFLSGTATPEIVRRNALLGDVTAQALLANYRAEEYTKILFQARREVLGSPLEELRETRKILRATDGDAQVLDAAMAGNVDKVYKLRARNLPSGVNSQGEALMKEIGNLQQQINREKALSNLDPSKAEGRIDELKAQIAQKAQELERLTGGSLADSFGTKVYEMPDVGRLAELQARRRALEPYSKLADQAISEMETFFGNYGRLHPLEREYVRRVIPFWTFSKTMFKLAFQLPFLRTKQAFLWHQFAKMMMDSLGDDRLPSRFRNYLPIGGDEEGNIVFVRLNNLNPFEAATQTTSVGRVPGIPKFLDPRNNPFVKMAVESIGGYDLFTEKPMVSPTQFVMLNGSVMEYDPDTNQISQVIPQKKLIHSLFEQIPHMRVLGDILEASGAMKAGAYLKGKETPAINPDGTVTYNRSYMHAIARAAGFPVTIQDPDKVDRQHHILKQMMARRYRRQAVMADPETRGQLESILKDWDRVEVWE